MPPLSGEQWPVVSVTASKGAIQAPGGPAVGEITDSSVWFGRVLIAMERTFRQGLQSC